MAEKVRPRAAFLVHIGGHIAFDAERIAAYCADHEIFLIEDCAHAHGASWNGRKPGTYGDAGVYSLYATKTISTGEGGVLVSRRPEVVEHARAFRNYGKPAYEVHGLNYRMSEFTAALGLLQIERLPEIVSWKNAVARSELDPAYRSRLELPDGMVSGLYKYIVFDWLERSTGRVYDEPCHRIMDRQVRAAQHRLGGAQSFLRAAVLPPGGRTVRVLVTGGSGFIGSHVVDKLRARGHEPVIYDLRPSPWHEPGSVETVLGSITDREALERALHSCDAVAHLAAVADVNDVHAEPEDAERVNARGTVAVLEACRRAGVKRIVYASTIWVYSDCADESVDEDTLLPAPSHLYTSTKLAGELYCKAYQELYGIEYTILRFGIPYGPRAREAAVIPAFVSKAMRGEPLTLAGDGGQSRRFVYVEDLADGVALGLNEVAANRVYNLASDENVTIKQIAETVQKLIGDVSIVYTPARPGDFGGKIVSQRASRARARLDGVHAVLRGGSPLRRLAPRAGRAGGHTRGRRRDPGGRARRRGAASAGADHLGRHRRGARPAGSRGRARAQG